MMKLKMMSARIAGLILVATSGMTATASAQDAMLGEVRQFGSNFCPRGWEETKGQILPISQHTALFSLLGTMYGGDGRTTFALPDLRSSTGTSTPAHAAEGSMDRIHPEPQGDWAKLKTCIAMQGIYPARN